MNWLKALGGWVDSRMPMLQREWKYHMAEYYAPKTSTFGISSVCCPCWYWLSSWAQESGF